MRYRPPTSSVSFFIGFLVMLGWEGPLAIYLGLTNGSMAEFDFGLANTVFFWGAFGWWSLVDTIKIISRKLRK